MVERAKAALEGVRVAPWQVVGYGNLHAGEPGEHPPLGKIYGTANAAFVAAARSLVPELVAEVERLRTETVPVDTEDDGDPYYAWQEEMSHIAKADRVTYGQWARRELVDGMRAQAEGDWA